ncbi:rRNA-binding ribosome biosynthesis protein utp25 [Orbilia oligospora]|uniref:U3 small nucleolar RNA-associated protein 25 n=1 Tax=Orbilia oligospora TaxID=2813651 RepID=A0A7C8KPS4_ORBOL|nr:rRNA-binding ribosome biosynthesis protein utp25 [Orbilia oligospora]
MTFSALLDSFASARRKEPSKSSSLSHPEEPLQKRRKLHSPAPEISIETTSNNCPEENKNLTSYKAHFDVQEAPRPSVTPSTVVHPVLGRVTVSNTQLLSECAVDNSGPFQVRRIKPHIRETILTMLATLQSNEKISPYQSQLSRYIRNYADVALASASGTDREAFRRLVCSHSLAHVLTTRQIVLKNSARLAKQINSGEDETDGRRDQGFTRPKILFVLPTRNSCYEVINHIINLAQGHGCENRQRFNEEYGPGTERQFSSTKPDDFKDFFHGNSDDMFRIGVKLTRKTVKLFSKFYHSDIILASPLGLKSVISSAAKGGSDTDFLSSIEILYLDSADALQMQNWDHVESILASMNQMPKNAHDCDFSRVRNWYLSGNAASFRQTIISTAFLFPETNSLLSRYSRNYRGLIKFHHLYTGELSPYIPQVFTKIHSTNPTLDPDIRFEYFTKTLMPSWKNGGIIDKGGLLVFLSSYLDAIRLRNYFDKTGHSFGDINEYTSASDIARSRAHFSSGRYKILIYTERAHYFRRYDLKGVHNIFLYSMPGNAMFYQELVGFLRGSISDGKSQLEESKVRALFTTWDALKVERIVGSVAYDEIKRNDVDSVDFEFP